MAVDLVVLKAELVTDPLARGYAGMTHALAAASLNTVNRSGEHLQSITSTQLVDGLQADWPAVELLVAADKRRLDSMVQSAGDLYIGPGSKIKAALLALFPSGPIRTRLTEIVTLTISRAVELMGAGTVVTPSDVADAYRLP